MVLAGPPQAASIVVHYTDTHGQGFFDPTLGPARRSAFEFAANAWANTLGGTVPIAVAASMPGLGGSGASALLASAGAATFHRNFGAGVPDTWYAAALANELIGEDLNGPDTPEITISFNADVDGPEVLGSIGWYYGTDAQPGTDIDFVTIALHELGHGLNFADLVDANSGGWLINTQPGIFDRMLLRSQVGPFAELLDAERLAAIISDPLLWNGPAVVAFNGSPAAVYAPDPFQPGSSVSHWDPTRYPHELMVPFYNGAVHDPGLLLPALIDMGWPVVVATPTPQATAATPTATATPRPTLPSAQGTPPKRHDLAYVTNFDDGTVSVIDVGTTFTERVTATIPVEDGPLGAAASADGRRVYVANFRVGTLSVLSTRTGRVLDTIAVGDSANGVAVTTDGAFVVITDTANDQAAVIDLGTNTVIARPPAGPQPTSVVIGPAPGFAFIADYGALTVTVIDLGTTLRRAIIPMNSVLFGISKPGELGLAIAPTGAGAVTTFYPGSVIGFDANNLAMNAGLIPYGPDANAEAEAAAIAPDGSRVYAATHSLSGAGKLLTINTATNVTSTMGIGNVPAALAFSPDGQVLYVAESGSNDVVIDYLRYDVQHTVSVGAAPMGVAVAAVPEICDGDCNGDGVVTVDELLVAVNVALGGPPVQACLAADSNDDSRITADEIVAATRNALNGCPALP